MRVFALASALWSGIAVALQQELDGLVELAHRAWEHFRGHPSPALPAAFEAGEREALAFIGAPRRRTVNVSALETVASRAVTCQDGAGRAIFSATLLGSGAGPS